VFHYHLNIFREVYSIYSGATMKPGEDNFMSPGEFTDIFNNSGLINAKLSTRD
jgi:hypothetical protein